MAPLEQLVFFCPTLRRLSLRGNQIKSVDALDCLVRLKLIELDITDNPVCSLVPPAKLAAELVQRHPLLQRLNGAPVPGKEAAAASFAATQPMLRAGLPYHELQDMRFHQAFEMLTQELEKRTCSLEIYSAIYAPGATFSVSANVMGRTTYPPSLLAVARRHGTKLQAADAMKNLFVGHERIYEAVHRLPKLLFDPEKIYYDLAVHPTLPGLVTMSISGTVNFCTPHLFSFARTLYISATGSTICVVSDHITFTPFAGGPAAVTLHVPPKQPTPEQIAAAVETVQKRLAPPPQPAPAPAQAPAFSTPAPAFTTPAPAPAPAAPVMLPPPTAAAAQLPSIPEFVKTPDQNAAIDAVMRETKMNPVGAEMCLNQAGGDAGGALQLFRAAMAAGQVPADYFVSECTQEQARSMVEQLSGMTKLKEDAATVFLVRHGWHFAEALQDFQEMKDRLPPANFLG